MRRTENMFSLTPDNTGDAVRHRIFWLRLALSWIYSCIWDKKLQSTIKL